MPTQSVKGRMRWIGAGFCAFFAMIRPVSRWFQCRWLILRSGCEAAPRLACQAVPGRRRAPGGDPGRSGPWGMQPGRSRRPGLFSPCRGSRAVAFMIVILVANPLDHQQQESHISIIERFFKDLGSSATSWRGQRSKIFPAGPCRARNAGIALRLTPCNLTARPGGRISHQHRTSAISRSSLSSGENDPRQKRRPPVSVPAPARPFSQTIESARPSNESWQT